MEKSNKEKVVKKEKGIKNAEKVKLSPVATVILSIVAALGIIVLATILYVLCMVL